MRTPQSDFIQAVVPKGITLRVRDGAGFTVRVLEGRAWVAEEMSTDDKILDAGDSFQLNRPGLALIFAYTEARVEIAARGESPVPGIELGRGYRQILWMTFYATLARAVGVRVDRSRAALRRLRGLQPAPRRFSRT